MSELREALDQIVRSKVYRDWAAVSATDANKVKAEMAGTRRPSAGSAFALGLVRIARLTVGAAPPPPPPPPPPPVAYKKVAPRTAHKEGTSDARYCVHGQPGVSWDSSVSRFRDDVATYDENGLAWGGRSDGDPAVGTVGAKSMDGRSPCELPKFGDPTKNTGSWAI